MRFSILSLFPHYFRGPLYLSILKKGQEKGKDQNDLLDIRDFAQDRHKKVDNRPFGGGPGMVMMPGPVIAAIRQVKKEGSKVIYLSPQGIPLTSRLCQELAQEKHLILLCGHYEGIDERIIEKEVDLEVSIGDSVLTSGCPAAIVLVEGVSRFLPGVLGHD